MPDNSLRIAADPRTNSLLANGSSEKLATIGAILLRLDDARDEPPR
jgi:type II secretory pathway component GspD/PulD (secretin)